MEDGTSDGEPISDALYSSTVFADTCIFLNYVQQSVERDLTSDLIDGDHFDVVIGVTVANELEKVNERRTDIYTDFLDFLIEENGTIENYDPDDRHPYFQENDRSHVRDIQLHLSQLGDRAEVQRQLRLIIRSIRRRYEYLRDEILPDATVTQQPGLTVIWALDDVISNEGDRNVVGDAALWAAEDETGSGIFVTMDKKDLIEAADGINSTLEDVKDETWRLRFVRPADLPS